MNKENYWKALTSDMLQKDRDKRRKFFEDGMKRVKGEEKTKQNILVEKIIKKIRKMPNRDDKISCVGGVKAMFLDGGGVGRFDVIKLLEQDFRLRLKNKDKLIEVKK